MMLCGGFATRLEPISHFMPKALLPLGDGRPIAEHILDDLLDSGVKEIIISTNAKFLGQFDYWMKNVSSRQSVKMDLVVENTMSNDEKFGAIRGINYAIKNARISTDLLIVASDNLYDFSAKDAITEFSRHRNPVVGLYDINSIEEAKKFGSVELDNGKIISFEEKPKKPRSTLISTGIYVFPKESLGKFDEYLNDGNNPDAPGYFIKWLSENTEVRGHVYHGKWCDVGTLESYRKVFDDYGKKGR